MKERLSFPLILHQQAQGDSGFIGSLKGVLLKTEEILLLIRVVEQEVDDIHSSKLFVERSQMNGLGYQEDLPLIGESVYFVREVERDSLTSNHVEIDDGQLRESHEFELSIKEDKL